MTSSKKRKVKGKGKTEKNEQLSDKELDEVSGGIAWGGPTMLTANATTPSVLGPLADDIKPRK